MLCWINGYKRLCIRCRGHRDGCLGCCFGQGVRAVVVRVFIDRWNWLNRSVTSKHKPRLGIGPIFNVVDKFLLWRS